MKLLLNIKEDELKKQYRLTDAEIKTLEHTISGLTRKQVADILNVSLHTVKTHLESVYRKLKVHNKIEVVLKFIDINLCLLLIIINESALKS
jgi:DNA-binding CsgD family transcriptional regulator